MRQAYLAQLGVLLPRYLTYLYIRIAYLLGVLEHTCDPGTWEVEDQEFKTSPRYTVNSKPA